MTIQECYNIYLMSCEDDTDKIMTFEEYVNETIRMEQYGKLRRRSNENN